MTTANETEQAEKDSVLSWQGTPINKLNDHDLNVAFSVASTAHPSGFNTVDDAYSMAHELLSVEFIRRGRTPPIPVKL
jgi:hypothetical protein